MAARGRERLGVQISSARAVGELVVRMGGNEIRRISGRVAPPASRPPRPSPPTPLDGRRRGDPGGHRAGASARVGHRRHHRPDGRAARRTAHRRDRRPASASAGCPRVNGNVPPVSTLSIPGFDTLSASQVVQRLDGLSREELVSVRAYETSTRGRRTILNRVDQLLEERA